MGAWQKETYVSKNHFGSDRSSGNSNVENSQPKDFWKSPPLDVQKSPPSVVQICLV